MPHELPRVAPTVRPGMLAVLCLLIGAPAAWSDATQASGTDAGSGSHERHVERVYGEAADAYARVLAAYDAHLDVHPTDLTAAIERCRFVSQFLYEDNDVLAAAAEEDFDRCLTELESGPHAGEPIARLFVLDQQWGAEAIAAGESLVFPSRSWPPDLRARLHTRLAVLYFEDGDDTRAGTEALHAVALDPGSEAALLAGDWLERMGAKRRAQLVVTSVPLTAWDATSAPEAAALLLRLGDARGAIDLLRDLVPDVGTDARFLFARSLAADGQAAAARDAYVAAISDAVFEAVEHRRDYFAFERDHGSPDQVAAAYARLREYGYWADPFGRYRIDLLLSHPFAAWTWLDAAGLIALLAVIGAVLLAPLVIVAPMHYYSLARRARSTVPPTGAPALPWGLGHAWWALAALLGGGTIALYVCAYPDFEAILDLAPYGTVLSDDRTLGRAQVLGMLLVVVMGAPLLRGVRWGSLLAGHWPLRRSLGMAAVLVVVLRFVSSLLTSGTGSATLGTDTTRAFQGIHAEYGIMALLLVGALIVPLVEEIVFRGVLLNGLARHVWFPAAAVIQAGVFALLHEDLSSLPLIFVFGLTAAWLYRRSGGLAAPLALHAFNNALACLAIVRATGALDGQFT